MSKQILTSAHAEDVGSAVVEPGQEIPADADPDVVDHLKREGKVADVKSTSSKSSNKEG